MRKYKFRAWLIEENKMVYPDGYDYEIVYGSSYKPALHLVKIHKYSPASFVDVEIMLSTGLKDVKGREIYEGDIVKGTPKFSIRKFKSVGEVVGKVYFAGSGFFVNSILLSDINNIEVIGNIYENPELLKGE